RRTGFARRRRWRSTSAQPRSPADGERRRLPALPVDDLLERFPPALAQRSRQRVPLPRIAERDQVTTAEAFRQTEQLARPPLLVHRRVHGADAELERGQHHVLGALAEVEG